jgi:hypothetical protein
VLHSFVYLSCLKSPVTVLHTGGRLPLAGYLVNRYGIAVGLCRGDQEWMGYLDLFTPWILTDRPPLMTGAYLILADVFSWLK